MKKPNSNDSKYWRTVGTGEYGSLSQFRSLLFDLDMEAYRAGPWMKPIISEVCDRLGCKVASCYGWDLCRQAREEATHEEWERLWSELFSDEAYRDFVDRAQKLEAVRKWKYGILLRMPLIGNQGHISRSDLDELEKILETVGRLQQIDISNTTARQEK